MFEVVRHKLRVNRKVAFAAGVTVGAGLTYVLARDPSVFNPSYIKLTAHPQVLNWLAESGHKATFNSPAGEFVLHPPV